MEEDGFFLFALSVVVSCGFALASALGKRRYVALGRLGPERLIAALGPWHNPRAWIAFPAEAETIGLTFFALWLLGWTWRFDRRGTPSGRYRAAGIALGLLALFFSAALWNLEGSAAWVGPVEGAAWTLAILLAIRKERHEVAPRFRQTKALVRLFVFGGIQMFVRPALTPLVQGMLISAFNVLVAFELFAPSLWRAWRRDEAWQRDYYDALRDVDGGAYADAREMLATQDGEAFLSWVEGCALEGEHDDLSKISEYRAHARAGERAAADAIARDLHARYWSQFVAAVGAPRALDESDEEAATTEAEEPVVYASLSQFAAEE